MAEHTGSVTSRRLTLYDKHVGENAENCDRRTDVRMDGDPATRTDRDPDGHTSPYHKTSCLKTVYKTAFILLAL